MTYIEFLAREVVTSITIVVIHGIVAVLVDLRVARIGDNLYHGTVVSSAHVRVGCCEAKVDRFTAGGHIVSNDSSRSGEWCMGCRDFGAAVLGLTTGNLCICQRV